MNLTITPKLAAAAAAGTLLLGSAAAVAATSAPSGATGGAVKIWVSQPKGNGNNPVQKIMITGAIGDFGKAISQTKSGKRAANGKYVHIVLQKGTFMVNAVAFGNKADKVQPTLDKSSCSAWATLSGPVTVYDGTGAYAGISGHVRISTSFAAVFATVKSGPKKGACVVSNKTQPSAQYNAGITGSGTVSFS